MLALAAVLALLQPVDDLDERDPDDRTRPIGLFARASAWHPSLSGTFDADEGWPVMLEGTSVELDEDLGLKGDETVPYLEFGAFQTFESDGRSVELDLVTYTIWFQEWEADKTLARDETFNGFTFPAGSPVESDLRILLLGIDATVVPVGHPARGLVGGMTVGMRYLDVDLQMERPGASAAEGTRLLYFGAGFGGTWKPGRWFFGSAQGSLYFTFGSIEDEWLVDFEDWGGVLFEGSVSMGAEVGPFRAEFGWRLIANSFAIARSDEDSDEENEFSWAAGGPFVGMSFRF